jgi:hypothetical protein
MNKIQWIFTLSGAIAVASLGFVVYQMFWGPERIDLAGRGLPELVESGDLVPVIVIPIVLLITAFSMRPFLRIIFPDQIRNGVTARARVLRVWDTGVTINDDPQIGLQLEVSPPGSSPFQVEAKTLVSRLQVALVQPGIEAEVLYDPQKPTRLRVQTLHIPDAATSNTAARLEELNSLRDKGLITEEEYRRKREEILKAL